MWLKADSHDPYNIPCSGWYLAIDTSNSDNDDNDDDENDDDHEDE